MEKELKTNWDALLEAYSRQAYLRHQICETKGELKKLQNEETKNSEKIALIENKIIKENEDADKI